MALLDIIKNLAGTFFYTGSEKLATKIGNSYAENKMKKAGYTEEQRSDVHNAVKTGDTSAFNQDAMMEDGLKKSGYSPEQIKELMLKMKSNDFNK